jgi:hypothetical protein
VHIHGHVGDRDLLADIEALEERFPAAAAGDELDVLLDLSEVWSIHPLCLARLVNLASRLDPAHRSVRWHGLRKGIARVLATISPAVVVSGERSAPVGPARPAR